MSPKEKEISDFETIREYAKEVREKGYLESSEEEIDDDEEFVSMYTEEMYQDGLDAAQENQIRKLKDMGLWERLKTWMSKRGR